MGKHSYKAPLCKNNSFNCKISKTYNITIKLFHEDTIVGFCREIFVNIMCPFGGKNLKWEQIKVDLFDQLDSYNNQNHFRSIDNTVFQVCLENVPF